VQAALQARRPRDAEALLAAALQADPNDHAALRAMANVRAMLGDPDGAIEQFRRLIRLTAEPLPLINELAGFCQRFGRQDAMLPVYERFLKTHPGSALGHYNYAWYAGKAGKPQVALDHFQRALDLDIGRPEEVHLNMANVCSGGLRDDTRARRHLEKALALQPGYPAAQFNLGHLAEQEGRLEEARERFGQCLAAAPDHFMALARLADTHDFAEGHDELLKRLEEAALRTPDPDVHFALGRALEQRADYAGAWRHYAAANETDAKHLPPYRPDAWERRIDQLISTCTPAWLHGLQQPRDASPVFICGMLRSGSTLLEQMLAMHPAFAPAGEREFLPRLVAGKLPRYPEGLAGLSPDQVRAWARAYQKESMEVFGGTARLTDKRPDNFLFAGLIKAMFPQAKIIVTRRDWRDVATSLFATRLGPAAGYATDLGHIRHFVGQHDRLVAHWQDLLGDDLLTVEYEKLVADPRGELTRLLAGLGEPWDERCLAFHEATNSVRTASVWQVRKPLYASSAGRWQRFRTQFDQALGEEAVTYAIRRRRLRARSRSGRLALQQRHHLRRARLRTRDRGSRFRRTVLVHVPDRAVDQRRRVERAAARHRGPPDGAG